MAELKPCPFCGEIPYIERKPLWTTYSNGTTHGYYGCFEYDIHCHKCGCKIPLGKNDTIYNSDNDAKQNAIKAWNTRYKETNSHVSCKNCINCGWDMPQCRECYAENNFKWFRLKEE